jgi:hypothetical protein
VYPSSGQNIGSQRVLNQDCMENEGEQSTPLLQLPPLCRSMCSLTSYSKRTWFSFPFGWFLWIHCFNFFNVCT